LSASRKFSLTAAGAVFCLLVIFIHVISPVISGADRTTAAYAAALSLWRLSAFVVQGFILLAGVKLGLKFTSGKINWANYYLSRLTRIVLPYIIWVVVYYLWFWWQHYYDFSLYELLRYILVGDLSAHFYFVIAIVQLYALAPVWKWFSERIPAAFALPAAALISLLSAQYMPYILDFFCGIRDFAWSDRVFTTYLLWWLIGLYIGRDWEAFEKSLRRSRWFIAAATLFAGGFDALLCYNSYVGGVSFGYAEPVHMLYCVCVIMLVLSFGGLIGENTRAGKLLFEIDRAGYGIYLSHVLVLLITAYVLDSSGITKLSLRFIICAAATYLISLAVNILYCEAKANLGKTNSLRK
jgi:Uncharacterized protein conserved in bacteria